MTKNCGTLGQPCFSFLPAKNSSQEVTASLEKILDGFEFWDPNSYEYKKPKELALLPLMDTSFPTPLPLSVL